MRPRQLAAALALGAAVWLLIAALVLHGCEPGEEPAHVVTVAMHEPREEPPATTSTTTPPSTTTSTTAPSSGFASSSEGGEPVVAQVRGVWDRLAGCEADGRWQLDARYDGGLQFDPPTWSDYVAAGKPYALAGFPPYAWQATREQQITVALRVRDGLPGSTGPYLNAQGWGAWPRCSRILGLR